MPVAVYGMRQYQLAKLDDLVDNDNARLLVLRYGTGKSWVALAAADRHRRTRAPDRKCKAIVLCRLRNIDTWTDEIEKRDPGSIVRSSRDKPEEWSDAEYLLIPHHLVGAKLRELCTFISKYQPHSLICDESTKIKNVKAKRTTDCLNLSEYHHRYVKQGFCMAMTGNATPEGAHEIWSQIHFASYAGTLIGQTYFTMLNLYFLASDRGPVLKYDRRDKFYTNAGRHVVRMTPDEWAEFKRADRLAVTYQTERYVETAEQKDLLDGLFSNWAVHHDGVLDEYTYAVQCHSKAQQFANGFWRDTEDWTHWLDESPKVELLVEIVEDLLEEAKGKEPRSIVIWCHYREDYEMLDRALTAKDITVAIGPEADAIQTFVQRKAPVILMPVTVSEGFNELAEVSDTAIFFSNVYSIETRDQAEHRHIRLNQKAPIVTIIDLCGTFSHDRKVIEALQCKRPISKV